ncbi:MAG TPA: hypothetical protein VFJ58_16010 [Armatimonadota bacterium]|nr:hypothetical protein [Armatimonadota bacterium]
MSIEKLLREAYRLPRQDKLRLAPEPIAEPAAEEGRATGEYPVWSPYEAHDAAAALLRLLDEEKAEAV